MSKLDRSVTFSDEEKFVSQSNKNNQTNEKRVYDQKVRMRVLLLKK